MLWNFNIPETNSYSSKTSFSWRASTIFELNKTSHLFLYSCMSVQCQFLVDSIGLLLLFISFQICLLSLGCLWYSKRSVTNQALKSDWSSQRCSGTSRDLAKREIFLCNGEWNRVLHKGNMVWGHPGLHFRTHLICNQIPTQWSGLNST